MLAFSLDNYSLVLKDWQRWLHENEWIDPFSPVDIWDNSVIQSLFLWFTVFDSNTYKRFASRVNLCAWSDRTQTRNWQQNGNFAFLLSNLINIYDWWLAGHATIMKYNIFSQFTIDQKHVVQYTYNNATVHPSLLKIILDIVI